MLSWSVPAIITASGGVASLRRMLAQAGQDVPDRATINMWRQRNRLPTAWSAPIVYVLATNYPGIDLCTLMMEGASDNDSEDTDTTTTTTTDDLFGDGDKP